MRKNLIRFLPIFFLLTNLLAQQPQMPESTVELRNAVSRILEETGTPAAGVALVTRDEITWVDGIGKADVTRGVEAGPNTLFRVGSISKSFVSLSILKLQEEGKLTLEDLVRDHVPEIEFTNPWEDTNPVLLVHLLEHTSGFDDMHLREYAHNDPGPIDLLDALNYHPASRTVRWIPGMHHSYCNSGPALAAYIVEKITGQKFEDYVQENFLKPLNMAKASFFLSGSVQEDLAKGYETDGVTEAPYWHILLRPAGALNASPREMANFVQMLLNRGSFHGASLLSPDSISRMEIPTSTLAARQGIQVGYGLGNFTTAHRSFLFRGHDGGINAYLASYGYLPQQGLGFIYMINSVNGKAFEEIGKLLRNYLTRNLRRPPSLMPDLPEGRLAGLTRYYRPITPRQEVSRFLTRILGVIRIEAEGPKLSVAPLFGEPKDLLPVTERKFRAEEDPLPSVAFQQIGRDRLVVQGASSVLTGNYESASVLSVWIERIVAVTCFALMASSLLFSLIWFPRWLLGRLRDAHLNVRALQLLATICLIIPFGLIFMSLPNMKFLVRYGTLTLWSLSFAIFTWLFAALAAVGLIQAVRSVRWPIDPNAKLHSILVALANVTVLAYLAYWGIIGLRTWT